MSLKITNTGSSQWVPGAIGQQGGYVLMTDDNGPFSATRFAIPDVVDPGQSRDLHFFVDPPSQPGQYHVSFRMGVEGEHRFGQECAANFTVNGPVAPVNDASCTIANVPDKVNPNAQFTVQFTFTNRGNTTWKAGPITNPDAAGTYYLMSRNDSDAYGPSRIALPHDVAPGESVTVSYDAKAPAQTGVLAFQMGERSAGRFGQDCGAQINVQQTVVDGPTVPSGACEITSIEQWNALYTSGSVTYEDRPELGYSNVWIRPFNGIQCVIAGGGYLATYKAFAPYGTPEFHTTQELFSKSPVVQPVAVSPALGGGVLYNFPYPARPGCLSQDDIMSAASNQGLYLVNWRPQIPGVNPNLPVCQKAPAATYESVCQAINAPDSVSPGQVFSVQAFFKNVGTATWTEAGPFADAVAPLANAGDNSFGLVTQNVKGTVPPQNAVQFLYSNAQAPTQPGTYNLSLQMLKGATRYGAVCRKTITVAAATPGCTYSPTGHITDPNVSVELFKNGLITATLTPSNVTVVNKTNCTIDVSAGPRYDIYKVYFPDGHPLRYDGQIFFSQSGPVAVAPLATVNLPGSSLACSTQYDLGFGPFDPNSDGNVNNGHYVAGSISTTLPLCTPEPSACTIVSAPDSVTPGQQFQATFRVTNNLRRNLFTWQPGPGQGHVLLMSNDPTDNDKWGTSRVALTSPLSHGQSQNITATFTAPTTTGSVPFHWQMGVEGAARFANVCGKEITVQQAQQPINNATCSISGIPPSVVAGQTFGAQFNLQNTGNTTWRAGQVTNPDTAGVYYLMSVNPNDNQIFGNSRYALQSNVAPNTPSFILPFQATAPSQAGTYTLAFQMGEAQAGRFGQVCQGTVVVTPAQIPLADLSVTKQSVETSVVRPGIVHYTITVNNSGTADAQNVRVVDVADNSLTFDPASSDTACALMTGTTVWCNLGTVAKQQTRVITLGFRTSLPPNCTGSQTIQNTASVSTSTQENNTTNNQSAPANTRLDCPAAQGADLKVEKSGSVSMQYGDTAIYTLRVTNLGPAAAQSVKVNDYSISADAIEFLPSQSSSQCHISGVAVSCDNFNLAVNEVRDFQVAFRLTPLGQGGLCVEHPIQDYATVSSQTTDSNLGNNTSTTVSTQVTCPTVQSADLSISKQALQSTATPGSLMRYQITVVNAGPAVANQVVVTDPIPAGLTFSAPDSSSNCAVNGSNVVCANFNLNANESRSFTIAFAVPASLPCGGAEVIRNTASVTSSTNDSVPGNNVSTQVTTPVQCVVNPGADLFIVKTGPAAADRGTTVTYTLTATNAGPGTATNVHVTDPIPAGLVFNAAASTSNCVQQGTNIVCNNFQLTSGQSKVEQVAFDIPSSLPCGAVIQNVASVSTSATDPNPLNNQSSVIATQVTCPQPTGADVTISKSGPQAILRDNTLTYTLTATNAGPGTATNVVINDQMPVGLTFTANGSDSSCSVTNGTLSCGSYTIANGQTRSVTVNFTIASTFACNGTIQNTASVTASSTDPTPANNTSNTVSTTVNCAAPAPVDLSITKSGPASVTPGNVVMYTLTAHNAGPGTATNVALKDVVPTGLTFAPAQSSQGCAYHADVNSVVCDNITLTPNETRSVQVAFTTAANLPCNSYIVNTASVATSATESNPANNQSNAVSTQVQCIVVNPTFTISKTDNRTVINPGETDTYSVTVVNTSAVAATNVSVTDYLPNFVNFLSASDGGTASAGQTVTWNNLSIAAGATKTLQLQVTLAANAPSGSTITNIVQIANGPSAYDTTTIGQLTGNCSNCIVTKTDNRTTINAGESDTYTITIQNPSNIPATNVSVTDVLPTSLNYVFATDGATLNGQTITWSNLTVPANSSKILQVIVTVNSNAPQGTVITNTAQVTGGQSGSDSTTINQISNTCATCTVTKTDNRTTINPGESNTYTITIQNPSNVAATGVSVNDVLPSYVTFISASDGGTLNGQTVTWTNITVPANSSKVLQLTVLVQSTAPQGAVITNTALVVGGQSGSDSTTIGQATGNCSTCIVTKTDNRTTINPGESNAYTITIQNTSNVTATNVTVTDILPSYVNFSYASDGGTLNGQTVTWTNLTIPANSSKILSLVVTVQSNAPQGAVITNTAQVTGGQSGSDSTTIGTSGNGIMTITKTDNRTEAYANDTLNYVITLTSNSSQSQTVTVTDILPQDLIYVSASENGYLNGQTVTWSNIYVPAYSTKVLNLSARVNGNNTQYDHTITNTAQINGGTSATDSTLIRGQNGGGGGGCVDIDIRDLQDPVRIGDQVTYEITLRNNQSYGTRTVDVRAQLDQNLSFLDSSSYSTGNNYYGNSYGNSVGYRSGDYVNWNGVTVDANYTRVLRFTARVNSQARNNDSVRVRASTNCNDVTEYTRIFDDRIAIAPPPIRPPVIPNNGAVLTVSKYADRSEAQPGDQILYTVTIRNQSNAPATTVRVSDTFVGSQMSIIDQGGGQVNGGGITWDVGTLDANQVRTFSYRAQLNGGLRHGDVVRNDVSANADNAPYVSASAEVRIIQALPQTGEGGYTDPIPTAGSLLRPIGSGHAASATAAVLWTMLSMGVVAGGSLMRRRFFL